MLSYNTSISVNGQRTPTSGASPKAARLNGPGLSNGVLTNGSSSTNNTPAKEHHIWLVTGPAGCGKSTVAKHLADSLHLPFIEGDEVCLHPANF